MARNSFKRYWPILLLAAGVAERAHAPLMSGALGASDVDTSAAPAKAAVQYPAAATKNAKSDLGLPPVAGQSDPAEFKKKPKDWETPADPLSLWDINPAATEPTETAPIDLLGSNQPNNLAASGGTDFAAGGDASGGYSADPLPPVSSPAVYGGDSIDYAPPSGSGQVPSVHHGITVTGVVAVPEPGMMPAVVGGLVMLARRGKRGARSFKSPPQPDARRCADPAAHSRRSSFRPV